MQDESTGNIKGGVSEATVRRMSNYFRILGDLIQEGETTISSDRLADRCGITSAQVRKDFSSFGSFGRRGLGYKVDHLRESIGRILGIDRSWNMVLVGAGNLGQALFQYPEFHRQGFHFCAIFDHNLSKVGKVWDGVMVHSMDRLDEVVRDQGARIGVIAVPAEAGQEVADRLVKAGAEGILNFSPVKLSVPEPVYIRNVNLAIALESLSYSLTKHRKLKLF